jgi:ERCC4-type nuclease
MYILDIRERELIKLLPTISTQQLPIGDIWFGVDQETGKPKGIIAERKTIRDLEASILDGRYREQRTRLLSYAQETSSQPLYIIEGTFQQTTGRLSPESLMKTLLRFQYKYSIPVIQTAHIGETAILLNAIDKYYEEDPTNFQRSLEPLKITDAIHVQKKANATDTRHFAIACLSQCPGVSAKMAEAIITNYKSLKAFIEASEEEIASIKHGTRKVGPAVAKRLYALFHTDFTISSA